MNTDKLFPFMYIQEINNNTIDNKVTQGIYRYYDTSASDYPIPAATTSMVLVLVIPGILTIQMAITHSDYKKILVRSKMGSGNWGRWYTLQGV